MIVRTFLLIGFLVAFSGCSSDDETPASAENCGCGEEQQISNLSGTLSYTGNQSDSENKFYPNQFLIKTPIDCENCDYYFICNPTSLSMELKSVEKDLDSIVKVKFSGIREDACQEPADLGVTGFEPGFFRL